MTRSESLVSVGIVTWNNERHLRPCLAALSSQTYRNLELIIVDNASQDRSAQLAAEILPQGRLLRNRRNEGYCRAHNQAVSSSRGEYYLALNPDVILQPRYVAFLVQALESRPEFGSAMGKLWLSGNAPGEPTVLDGTGLFIDRRRRQYLRGHGEPDLGQYDVQEEVFGADGAAPLYRRQALEDARILGEVFDEEYFGYHADVDLAWRCRLLGWKCVYESRAVAVHERRFRPRHRRGVPRRLRRQALKNRYLTVLKNESAECFRRDWWRILTYDVQVLAYVAALEQTSLPAYAGLAKASRRALQWRRELWKRVRVDASQRLLWFR